MGLLTEKTRQPGDPTIDATKNRVVAVNVLGSLFNYIQDPDVVQDIYNKHNPDMDRHKMVSEMLEPLFKDVFGTMPTNDEWKRQRKAISHMFFK